MARPYSKTYTPADVDDDGIAQNQTPGAAGALTLNGALGTTLDYARILVITTASNESAKTLTFLGTDANGSVITEVVTGPNATTANTTKAYKTVTSITVSAAFTGNVKVGTTSAVYGAAYQTNNRQPDFQLGFGCDISGTINYTIQHAFEAIQTSGTASLSWFPHSAAASKTADYSDSYLFPITATRVVINSYSSGATLKHVMVMSE